LSVIVTKMANNAPSTLSQLMVKLNTYFTQKLRPTARIYVLGTVGPACRKFKYSYTEINK